MAACGARDFRQKIGRDNMPSFSELRSIIGRLLISRKTVDDLEKLRQECGFVPPGHYYSPIPSLEKVRREEATIFEDFPRHVPGIDLRESEQLNLLEKFLEYYQTIPFGAGKTQKLRYYFENPNYSYSDAIFFYCMIRYAKPKRIIEIGSGFSSCVTLDTNELFFDDAIKPTLIEPYPELLMSLLNKNDENKFEILRRPLEMVDLDVFEALEPNDILFVDSTHVSKINSDVNRIFFDILPVLSSGVYIHFHDVFFPFEYPKQWIYQGIFWNETYILRSFLQYNNEFRIVLMNTFMEHWHEPFFAEKMPLCLKNPGGSIWIQKVTTS